MEGLYNLPGFIVRIQIPDPKISLLQRGRRRQLAPTSPLTTVHASFDRTRASARFLHGGARRAAAIFVSMKEDVFEADDAGVLDPLKEQRDARTRTSAHARAGARTNAPSTHGFACVRTGCAARAGSRVVTLESMEHKEYEWRKRGSEQKHRATTNALKGVQTIRSTDGALLAAIIGKACAQSHSGTT
eukprot:3163119-Pleurochrysis_carterae.AAC.3